MSNIASQLLQKVKESIKLRNLEPSLYTSSFNNPSSFITATIGGNQEFIPIELLCSTNEGYGTLLDLYNVFGIPESNIELNQRLKSFYESNDIDWPTQTNDSELLYYVKPTPKGANEAFFNSQAIDKLSNYAGTHYKASDAFLKDLGATYAEEIVDKTNHWVESLNIPAGYVIEPERYWQVAGRFKSFTWAKIYKKSQKDRKVFFSVGVDVQNKKLVLKLDILRSGTHKLSNFEIRDFDYFTQNKELLVSYNMDQIVGLELDALTFIANKFIANSSTVYEQVIDFIWNDSIDCSLFKNKIFKLSSKYKSNNVASLDKIIEKDIINLIIDYETYVLTHANREELVEHIKTTYEQNLHLIKSFETDGKEKTILFKVSTGGTSAELEMSRKEIEFLGDNLHTVLYHIVEYNINQNCGKLIIRKGSPTKYAELKSINYEVKIG